MSRVRVHNMFVSLDGFAAGTEVTLEKPIGDAQALFSMFDGRTIAGVHAAGDDPITLDRMLTSTWGQGIGVEIMGRRKFGPQSGPWETEDDWVGWWGDDPPFRTPCVVLTHHEREPITFTNGTSFHFVDADPEQALARARELADGDVRLGGGPSTVRQFLEADLVDFLHLVVVPVTLGEGVSLWAGLEHLQDRFDVEVVPSASGLEHRLLNRRPR